ncbi:hypothetical protein [Limnobacter sp.]|uniref:hypothetical protein n=1 Tax=Limnobacter sp. TaxID=2003368 RepID=UPI0039C90813
MTDRDWRLQTTGNLAQDWLNPWTGQLVPKGTRLTVVTVAKLNSKRTITVPVPNGSAILLSASEKAHHRAKSIRTKNKIDTSLKKEIEFSTESEAFDYLEDTIQSIVLAYSAIEAFANEMIPDDYQYSRHIKSEIILETSGKEAIERFVPLEEKLSVILPEILKVPSPKATSRHWSEFKKLKKLRDRIIHMKSADRKSSGPENETLWHQLLKPNTPHKQAIDVIRYFTGKMSTAPQWIENAKI